MRLPRTQHRDIHRRLGGFDVAVLSRSEADRLRETVRTKLTGSGVIAETADALCRHRNTVQHRFARFHELTAVTSEVGRRSTGASATGAR
ncbi:helix-turn-helix domain-containing protein [Streptomyces sp. bgisy031]|uniref:helix-turn-helix domain-containing protein n=1 Tax=Streptomyces sp. bgisy031 TaxID=3413772 RepID=UPI003D739B3E